MAKGEKKSNLNGWRISGFDSLGRPIFKKDIQPTGKGSKYKDLAKSALDPMSDVRKKPDFKKLEDLPPEFYDVYFENDGSSWDEISEDGNTLYGTHHATGEQVTMSRQGKEIVIAVGDEVKSVIGPAEERELKMRYAEAELGGDAINRKHIKDVNVFKDDNGQTNVEFEDMNGSVISYVIDDKEGTATGYITVRNEQGKWETREISQNIPIDEISELSNEIAKEDGKESTITRVGRAVLITKYMRRQWKKYQRSRPPKAEIPNPPFTGALMRFFKKIDFV